MLELLSSLLAFLSDRGGDLDRSDVVDHLEDYGVEVLHGLLHLLVFTVWADLKYNSHHVREAVVNLLIGDMDLVHKSRRAESLEYLSNWCSDDLIGDLIVLSHHNKRILVSHLLIRKLIVLWVGVANKVFDVWHLRHLGLQVLSPAHKELDWCLLATKVKRNLDGDGVLGALKSLIEVVSEEALSSEKVELEVGVMAVLSARSEVVVLRVGSLHDGQRSLILLGASEIFKFLVQDRNCGLSPNHGNGVVHSFAVAKFGDCDHEEGNHA